MPAVRTDMAMTVGGMIYADWIGIKFERGIDRLSSSFDFAVSERWAINDAPWQIRPFDPCTLKIGSDLILTGFVDVYLPEASATSHSVRIGGRSKTEDLVDCMTELDGSQFTGYRLDQIARAVCKPFGIDVVVKASVGEAFPDATIEDCETAFRYLERLGRLRGVLLSDDAQGRLVLTTAGSERAKDSLVQGQNIVRQRAVLSAHKRFSRYIVHAQNPIDTYGEDAVETQGMAIVLDPAVPRYRPHISHAESQLDQAGMEARAKWQAAYAGGRSVEAEITVCDWRQSDGSLWRENLLVYVKSPFLQIDRKLLISKVAYLCDNEGGVRTTLTVGPVEGFSPDPGEVKLKKNKGDSQWDGLHPIGFTGLFPKTTNADAAKNAQAPGVTVNPVTPPDP